MARLPGTPTASAMKRILRVESVAAARSSMATWLPASCVYFESACFSTPERSSIRPTFVLDAAIVEPTVRAGSGLRCVSETTSDGAAEG